MVAMMAGQELLAESDPIIEEGPVYEGVGRAIFDYLEFWDLRKYSHNPNAFGSENGRPAKHPVSVCGKKSQRRRLAIN